MQQTNHQIGTLHASPSPRASLGRTLIGRTTIRRKLVSLTALLVAGISLFIYLFVPARLEEQALAAIAAKATSIAEMSTYTLGPALDFDNIDEVEEALAAATQFDDLAYVFVQAADGHTIASFMQDAAGTAMPIMLRPAAGILDDGRIYGIHRPIAWRGEHLGDLYMGFSLAQLQEELSRSRTLISLMSLLVFLVGLGLVYGISLFITRPLQEIVRATAGVAQGDLTQRAHVRSRDEVGQLAASFNAMVDNLEQAYAALTTSEARFRVVIEQASDMVAVLNEQLNITYASPATHAITGFKAERTVGQHVLNYIHSDDRPIIMAAIMDGRAHPDKVIQVEVRWRHADGAWRYLSVRGRNLIEQAGINGYLVNVRDITEAKRFEQELVVARDEAQKMVMLKDAFLTNMSHELRTPLTGILGIAQILRGELAVEQRELVEIIDASGQRLLSTLNSVLDLAQLEADALHLNMEPTDLYAEIQTTVQLLDPLARQKNLALEVCPPPARIVTVIDRSGLNRILNNLVGNAIKFTQQGGVTVEMTQSNEHILLRVRDTGVGISEDFLPHLFDEFKQESTGLARTHEGNGLGLAITKRLVALMGGTIQVDSIKGLGTRFTIRLPYVPALAGALAEAPPPAVPHTPAGADVAPPRAPAADRPPNAAKRPGNVCRSVLVVEDTPATCVVLERWLRPHGGVAFAESSQAFYAHLNRQQFDLVLMDINLGGSEDGVALLHHLRQQAACAQTRVIALTAYALTDDRQRFLDAGFDGYLSKPFDEAQLLSAIDTVLATPAQPLPSAEPQR